jgi:hypothetical protein
LKKSAKIGLDATCVEILKIRLLPWSHKMLETNKNCKPGILAIFFLFLYFFLRERF